MTAAQARNSVWWGGINRIQRTARLSLVVVCLAQPVWADRVALIIGNGAYSGIAALPNPVNDARALGATLTGVGFDVDIMVDGDLAGLRQALETFAAEAAGAEVALVFFAGHGMQVNGSNYLLPTDIRLRTQADLAGGALEVGEVFDAFAEAAPETSILILDACRENPFTNTLGTSAGLASGVVQASATRPNAAGTIIAFSAAPGAVASDGVDGNSPYTTALLQWIDQPGIELGTMLRRVRRTVLDLTNGAQVPWVEEALVQDVFLNPGPAPSGPPASERIEVALLEGITDLQFDAERGAAQTFYDRFLVASAAGASDIDSDERLVRAGLIWLSIRESDDPEVFQAFIGEFPDGDFAMLAQMRLDELATAPPPAPAADALAWLDDLPPVPPRPGAPEIEVVELVETTPPAPPVEIAPPAPPVEIAPPEAPTAPETPEQDDITGTASTDSSVSPSGPSRPSTPGVPETEAPEALTEVRPGQPAVPQADTPQIDAFDGTAPREIGGLNPAPGTGAAPIAPIETVPAAPPTPEELETELALAPEELRAIQVLLAELGYYTGGIDGAYGPGTRGAITRLQEATGQAETGYLTVETLRQLVARAAPSVLSQETRAAVHRDVHDVAAIAVNGPGAEPEVIRVEAINRNDQVHALWRGVAREFEAENPGTLVEINTRPGNQYRVELMSILGAEDPPDILHTWSGGHLDALREAGFARDLTEEMGDGWAFEFKPGALQTYTHEGQIFGAPISLSVVQLYANRAVFERAGVPLESVATWQGFLDAVETFQAQGIAPLAVGGGDQWPFNMYYSQMAQRLAGRDGMDAGFAGEGAGFAAEPFQEAGAEFQRLADLMPFETEFMDINDGVATQLMAEGQAAMIVTGNWRIQRMSWSWPGGPQAMQAQLAALPFPTIGDLPQDSMTYGGADGFAVAEDAPDIAVDFLRRLTAIDVQEEMTRVASAIPSLSGADLAIDRPFLRAAADTLLTSTYHQLFYDQALGPEAGDVLNDGLYQVVLGQAQAGSVVTAVDAAWDEVLADRP